MISIAHICSLLEKKAEWTAIEIMRWYLNSEQAYHAFLGQNNKVLLFNLCHE